MTASIALLAHDGATVATVPAPPFYVPPGIIQWNDRYFVRGPDGTYREATRFVVPIETEQPDNA